MIPLAFGSTLESTWLSPDYCGAYGWWIHQNASRMWLPFHWICDKVSN